jgi:hypothetical protein
MSTLIFMMPSFWELRELDMGEFLFKLPKSMR